MVSKKFPSVYIMLVGILALFSLGENSQARQDLIPGSRYTSGRSAGVGDAFLPLGDDTASGLFFNPAILSRFKKNQLEPLNLALYGNSTYWSLIDSSFYKVATLNSYVPTLARAPGKFSGAGASILPSFSFYGISFGVLLQSEMAAKYNASDDTVTYRSLYELIPAMATSFKLAGGVLRFGYSLQWVNRAVGGGTLPSTSSNLAYNYGIGQGSGFSHTGAIALTIPMSMMPQVNLVIRDIFDTQYTPFTLLPVATSSVGAPDVQPMTVDASFSLHPRLGRGAILNLVLVDRDVTNRTGVDFMGHFALGAELMFKNQFFIRGGWRGGYYSAGIGLERHGAEVSLSWYTEEVGTHYMDQGDSRYMFQYRLRSF